VSDGAQTEGAMALPADAGAAGAAGASGASGSVRIPDAEPAAPGSIAASLPVGSELAQERPEVLVGAAFAGAFLFARILKHITTSSE
jgi:hypothetical protein